jgi:alpha-aminoadipate carrier protein LysW
MSLECPECGAAVQLPEDVLAGEILACANCAVDLDVVSANPPEVMVFEEDEK